MDLSRGLLVEECCTWREGRLKHGVCVCVRSWVCVCACVRARACVCVCVVEELWSRSSFLTSGSLAHREERKAAVRGGGVRADGC